MTRRNALKAGAAVALIPASVRAAVSAGRLKQSLARWCYAKIPIEDLCRAAADMGISGMDLAVSYTHLIFPDLRRRGLLPPASYEAPASY